MNYGRTVTLSGPAAAALRDAALQAGLGATRGRAVVCQPFFSQGEDGLEAEMSMIVLSAKESMLLQVFFSRLRDGADPEDALDEACASQARPALAERGAAG